ncbi:MAG: PTS fructose transporter subunit IIA [Elusimicrobia bacterium]|nr:PTS fructose transporter subunit IIA [Elusimicrobiota bacterium]
MINFLIVTHGEFGAYLTEAAESIVGGQEQGVKVLSISPRVGVAEIRERIRRAIRELSGPDGLILFTDMPGGTPSNLAFPLVKDAARVEMITGVNLYMLVSAFGHRTDYKLPALVQKVLTDGQRSVCDVRRRFLERAG